MNIGSPANPTDLEWLSLRLRLWPHAEEAELLREMADTLARGHFVRLAFNSSGSAIGLVEASQRVDYVNGTSTSPVAFLEGLYVEPTWRRKAWRARSSLKSSAGRLLKVALSLRLIRQLRTSRPMQLTGRLGSRKQNVSFISGERFTVPNLSLNPDASPAAAHRPVGAG